MNIDDYLNSIYYLKEQYPSTTLTLFKYMMKKVRTALITTLDDLLAKHEVPVSTITTVSDFFRFGGDKQNGAKVLEGYLPHYHNCPLIHAHLGDLYWDGR